MDILLLRKGLLEGREQAKEKIVAGLVSVNGRVCDKPGEKIPTDAEITVLGRVLPYVSRGGLKLEKALACFPISLKDAVAMDIGASTGGFTDCMLQNGARKVYAVDVGFDQLAEKLRTDARVVNLEKTNIRFITEEQVPEQLDFFSVDVSFISLTQVLPAAMRLLKPGGEAVCLIKPQFEVGKGRVGKKGVVRDADLHSEVLEKIGAFACSLGFSLCGLDFSPIKGPEGNIEYLLYIRKDGKGENRLNCRISEVVQNSHARLNTVAVKGEA